jgi:hypothetical protein
MEVDGRRSEAALAPGLRRESMLLIVTFAASGGTQSGLRQLRIAGDGVRVNDGDDTGEVCRKERRREAGSGVENTAVSISPWRSRGARTQCMQLCLPTTHHPRNITLGGHADQFAQTARRTLHEGIPRTSRMHTANARGCVESHAARLCDGADDATP